MKLNQNRKIGFALLMLLTAATFAQTKIAPPPMKLEFNQLSKKENKSHLKERRLTEKVKSGKVNDIKKYLKQNTDLQKKQLEKYVVVASGLDESQLDELKTNLKEIKEIQSKASVEKSRSRDIKRNLSKTKRDSLKSKKIGELRLYGTERVDTTIKSVDLDSIQSDSTYFKSTVVEEWRNRESALAEEHKEQSGIFEDESALDSTLLGEGRMLVVAEVENKTSLNADSLKIMLSDSLSPFDLSKAASIDSSYFDVDELVNTKLKAYMEGFLSEKVSLQQLESITPLASEATSSVKHYIPDLETLDYDQPEIPVEKLKEAVALVQKENKKEEVKDLLSFKNGETSQEMNLTDRMEVGGFLEYKPQLNRIELTPSFSFGLNKKFSIGIGYQAVIKLSKKDSANTTTAYRSFLDYKFYKSYFLHTELEWVEAKTSSEIAPLKERNFYLGLGKSFQYKFIKTSVLVLYNFNAPSDLRTKPFTIRFAINFSK